MIHADLVEKFYTAFAEGDYKVMADCYHADIVFKDPAFGCLEGERAMKMWAMLLSQKKAKLKISYGNVQCTEKTCSLNWKAEYQYGKRKVINNVSASFQFKEGKIIDHHDSFGFWKWSRQALGLSGFLLGWTPFMKNKVQASTNQKLDKFMSQS